MWYVYQYHLYGNAYTSTEEYSYDDLYCEQCGDMDSLIATFETQDEAEDFVEKFNNGEVLD